MQTFPKTVFWWQKKRELRTSGGHTCQTVTGLRTQWGRGAVVLVDNHSSRPASFLPSGRPEGGQSQNGQADRHFIREERIST